MNCPHCHANLVHEARDGDPLLRTRGLVLKSDHLALVCPKCKGDVPVNQTLSKAIQARLVLFFRK